ncbi:MAG: hypothetical protein ACON4U_13910 [Myxococcota bacterium]
MKHHTFISWRTLQHKQRPLAQLGQLSGHRGTQILWYGDAPMLEMPQHYQIGTLRLVGRIQGRSCWVEDGTAIAVLGELPTPSPEILLWIYHRISTALDFLHHTRIGHGQLNDFSIGISETGDPVLIGVTGTSPPEIDRAQFMHMWNSVAEQPLALSSEPLHRQLPNQIDQAEALRKFTVEHLPQAGHTLRELSIESLHQIDTPQLDEFDKEASQSESSTINRSEHTLSPENTANILMTHPEQLPLPSDKRNALSRLSDWLHRDFESIDFDQDKPIIPIISTQLDPLPAANDVLIDCWPKHTGEEDWEQTATLMVTKSKTQHSPIIEPSEAPKPKSSSSHRLTPTPLMMTVSVTLTIGALLLAYTISTSLKGCI